jgi:hypothetical protein
MWKKQKYRFHEFFSYFFLVLHISHVEAHMEVESVSFVLYYVHLLFIDVVSTII